MADTHRYVLLYNPISNEGHLDSWHALFIKLLRQAGHSVIAVSPEPLNIVKKLKALGLEETEALVVLATENAAPVSLASVRGVWRRWQTLTDKALYQRSWYRLPIQVLDRAVRMAHSLYRQVRQHQIRPAVEESAKVSAIESARASAVDPKQFCDQVNRVLREYSGQVAVVLNMYVDTYAADRAAWANTSLWQDTPWYGLCISPSGMPTAGYYTLPSYRGTYFLDETVCTTYQQQMPERTFEYLPDIADTTLPETISSLAQEILERAANRKIVFMGGSIGKQKNLARWFDLIRLSNAKDWFFVQIGRLNHNNLLSEDQRALADIVKHPPENLWIQPEYLADERHFNEIISISSVIFAVYRDFGRSSNMLSKAAYFEKPILVAQGQLMGKRVDHYKIGLTVAQDSAANIYEGLLALDSIENIKDNFKLYRQDFNEDAMQAKLQAMFKNT